MSFQTKKFTSIVASMINWMSSTTTRVTDYNVGSVVRTILEAVAMELEELYYQLLRAVEEAIEEAIYRAFNFPRNPSERSTGSVRFTRVVGSTDHILIPRGTLVSTETEPPIMFETQADDAIISCSDTATGGSSVHLQDSKTDFVAEGIVVGATVINVTDNGSSVVTSISGASNETLNFDALTNAATFTTHYSKGSVSTDATSTVIGSGTNWISANVSSGDEIRIAGIVCEVSSVGSDTQLDLTAPFSGGTLSGALYAIYRVVGDDYTIVNPYADIPCQAVTPGISGNIAGGAITVLSSAVSNIQTVTNSSSFSDGMNAESNLARANRFSMYIRSLSRATRAALEYSALKVDQIVSAKAIDDVRPTVYTYDYNEGTYADITDSMRNPGDAYVRLFPAIEASGDCLYMGGDEPFNYVNMHLGVFGTDNGSPSDTHWEYYNGTIWDDLPGIADGTNDSSATLTQSGAISYTMPTDWAKSTIYGVLKYWIRLRIDGSVWTIKPTGDYCSLPPGLGYVHLYCHDGSGELSATLKTAVESSVELYRGCGIIVEVIEPTKVEPTITCTVTIESNYDSVDMKTQIQQAIIDFLNAKKLGEDLYVADLYQLVMGVNDTAITNCIISAPTVDIAVPSGYVLRADPALITVS